MYPKNTIEFLVYGDYALFSEPVTRVGGEKCSLHVPTYEALRGIVESIYWKPTIEWVIDEMRVMKPIRTETKGVATLKKDFSRDLSYYTYLKDVAYQVRAHFVRNENRPDLFQDYNEGKHFAIANNALEKGGRRDIFLGVRECRGFVEPCKFGEGEGYYDDIEGELSFGFTYHGITYADNAVREEDKELMTVRFWYPKMEKRGVVTFVTPENCAVYRHIKPMNATSFEKGVNFSGLDEFGEDCE